MFKLFKVGITKVNKYFKAFTNSSNPVIRNVSRAAVLVTGGALGGLVAVGLGMIGMLIRYGTIWKGAAFWTCLFKSLGFGISMYLGMFIFGSLIGLGVWAASKLLK